ncbi:3-oxoacyl-[acyl-carrier-protein] synthase III C-terminal domain-containing protein [Streptomyces sp. NPDC087300]|uniref:3-oxoacyl-[acyl-carrier-protein] synthase III C-terminal domain-containing protein n=1 Tax=Streptomyces sp. NPDC087300 TaxID=3365780 RepID=UPI0038246244
MTEDQVLLAGVGQWIPARLSTADAVAGGLLNDAERDRSGVVSSSVTPDTELPAMAARAALDAYSHAGLPARPHTLLYAVAGTDDWTPFDYLQRLLRAPEALACRVNAASNSALAAIALATSRTTSEKSEGTSLIVAAHSLSSLSVDRWRNSTGWIGGDGAAAIVLSAHDGFASLQGTSHLTQPAPASHFLNRQNDGRAGRRTATKTAAVPTTSVQDAAAAVMEAALTSARLRAADISHLAMPFFEHAVVKALFADPLGLPMSRTSWELGRTVGHVGPCDPLLGLKFMVDNGRLRIGDNVMMVSLGSSFTCQIWQITETPAKAPIRNPITL